jgi:hypothetical protein
VLLLFPEGGTKDPFSVPGDGVIPPHGGSPGGYHFAFSIAAEDVEPWRRRLESGRRSGSRAVQAHEPEVGLTM